MSALTITHTHEDGTLLDGSSKGDGVLGIVRRHGFRWFPSIKRIGVQQSRDQIAKRYVIDRAAEALRAAGHEVTVEIDDTPRNRGEVLADQAERLDERADRLTARAARHEAAADAHMNRADQISQRWEGGQPIIMGHHSTRTALRDRERMHGAMQRGVAEKRTAEEIAYAASRVGKDAAHAEKPGATRRRIATTEAELRVIARDLKGHTTRHLDGNGNPVYVFPHPPASGQHREQLLARQALLTERLTYDKAKLAEAEAAGFVVWGPDNVHVGDIVVYWGGRRPVAKVNKVTVSAKTDYSWMDKIKFTDIKTVHCTHGQPDTEPQQLDPIDEVAATDIPERAAAEAAITAALVAPYEREARVEAQRERDAKMAAIMTAEPVYAPGYFPTPPDLAARVADLLPAGPLTVLEPSAGDGALVRAVLDANAEAYVVAVEPNGQLSAMLARISADRLRVHRDTFEDFDVRPDGTTPPELFGAVVMNPPFSAPGHPVLWAEHVLRAYDHLAPGGRLVAIVPVSFEYRITRITTQVRELVTELGGFEVLPDDSFKNAGTGVRTVLIWLDRPGVAADVAPAPLMGEQLELWVTPDTR